MGYLSTFGCLRRFLGVKEELYGIERLLSFQNCPFLIALRYSLTFICIVHVDGDPVCQRVKVGIPFTGLTHLLIKCLSSAEETFLFFKANLELRTCFKIVKKNNHEAPKAVIVTTETF